MKKWQEIIQHATFRFIDQSSEKVFQHKPYDAIASFAIDDALATSVSSAKADSPPAMRLWVHPKTVVLGIPDSRVPYLEAGVDILAKQGYHVMIRNSGGLAVALDEGVLNISLVLPHVKQISIYDCYEAMVSFIQYMLHDLTNEIQAYEIVGSYCPGDYDLSIHGKKFAGISQRRVKDGAAIQIYLDVEGNAKKRAALIRSFYDDSVRGEETKFEYPTVNPEVMASLSELLNVKITVEDMKSRALSALQALCEHVVISNKFSDHEIAVFEKRYEQMMNRNKEMATMQ